MDEECQEMLIDDFKKTLPDSDAQYCEMMDEEGMLLDHEIEDFFAAKLKRTGFVRYSGLKDKDKLIEDMVFSLNLLKTDKHLDARLNDLGVK